MIRKKSALLLFALSLQSTSSRAGEIPPENLKMETPKAIASFEAKAKRLVDAINRGTSEGNEDLFFPREAFLKLKAIAKPEVYYQQLIEWFRKDLSAEQAKAQVPWSYVSFKLGSCRWKAPGSEANAIAYWSCYNSQIQVEHAGQKNQILVRTLINWGQEWYITHLHPLPKP